MRLNELGEFGLIDRIASAVGNNPSVRIGIGDDAAAIEPHQGYDLLFTSDMLIEGVHFDLTLSDPVSLGRKSLAVNLSDLAAMGAIPRYYLLSLAIPQSLDMEYVDAFISGMSHRASQFGVTLIGGDTCSSKSGFAISVTAIGEQMPQRVVQRKGAVPGDIIFVTGTVGDSALGLELLRRGEREGHLVMRHLDPEPRLSTGIALAEAGIATAMIDVSDGLAADLGHILEKSGVGARLELSSIPLSPEYKARAGSFSADQFSFAVSGGEDYELVFTASAENREHVHAVMVASGVTATAIGEITAGGCLSVIAPDGAPYQPLRSGYNHFA